MGEIGSLFTEILYGLVGMNSLRGINSNKPDLLQLSVVIHDYSITIYDPGAFEGVTVGVSGEKYQHQKNK
jgi:hypothetical protein